MSGNEPERFAQAEVQMHLEKKGARYYVRGNSFSIKDAIKDCGGHWDADERAWWVGAKKAPALQEIIDKAKVGSQPDTQGLQTQVRGKATYKGKTYYYTWEGVASKGKMQGQWCAKLVSVDGMITFWALVGNGEGQALITKEYQNARTIEELKAFAEKAREQKKNYKEDDPSTWSREQKKEHLDWLDQNDDFDECARLAQEWGIRDY